MRKGSYHPNSLSARPKRPETDRARIIALMQMRPDGITRQSIANTLGIPIQTICRRIADLLRQNQAYECGNVVEGGSKRSLLRLGLDPKKQATQQIMGDWTRKLPTMDWKE